MAKRKKLIAYNLYKMEEHLGLAGMVTKWLCRSHAERDEVWSDALYGLFHAARYCAPGRTFSTYAVKCMVGAIQSRRTTHHRFRFRSGQRDGKSWQTRVHLFSEFGPYHVGGNTNLFAYEPDELTADRTSDLYTVLVALLGQLSQRKARMVRMRFGLTRSRRTYTCDEIGEHFGITGGCASMHIRVSLDKIRASAVSQLKRWKTLFESIS